LRLIRLTDGYNDKEHSHSFFELHYVTKGYFRVEINNKTYEVKEDEYILISPSVKHKIIMQSEDFHKLVWGFEIEKGEVISDPYCVKKKGTPIQKTCIEQLFDDEFDEYGDVSVKLLLGMFLSRSLDFRTKAEKIFDEGSEVFERVERFISDNIYMPMTVEDIAQNFGVSTRHLSRLCAKFTGVSIGKYLRTQKVNTACALLSRCSVKETAEMLGYADEFSFSKSFRAVTGKNPSLWRKENR
jgi:AraC-like DNA-binding protein